MSSVTMEVFDLLHSHGFWKQDLISSFYGLRPCIRFGLDESRYRALKFLLPKIGLKMLSYTYNAGTFKISTVLIGKRYSTLKNAYSSDIKSKHMDLGRYLGYPECCIKAWEETKRNNISKPILVLQRTSSDKLDFKLNFLLNFDTRIGRRNIIRKLAKFNYTGWNKYIIPHIPCSFDCKVSKKYGADLFMLLMRMASPYAEELRFYLTKQVLFFNDCEFILFEGMLNKGIFYYRDFLDLNNLIEKDLFFELSKGNKLKIFKDKFIIFKDTTTVKVFKKANLIFNFSNELANLSWKQIPK